MSCVKHGSCSLTHGLALRGAAVAYVVKLTDPEGLAVDVLIVEDEFLIREVISQELSEVGLLVASASDAEGGLRVIEANGPCPPVIVTDVNLGPGMDGFALAEEAGRRWPAVAVVVISGDHRNETRLPETLRNSFLAKPFDMRALVRMVQARVPTTRR